MTRLLATTVALTLLVSIAIGGVTSAEAAYRTPKEINQTLKELANQHKSSAALAELTRTPGNRELYMLELGANDSKLPAILVVANMEGNSPMASSAALELARLLLTDGNDELATHRWYILACGNPDGYARYFSKPLADAQVNERPFNADKDDATDEDGPEDLNGDGYITSMRQAHPEGTYVEVTDNPLFMREVDNAKGEVGMYRLFREGVDSDGDGKLNEDGPGGVNPGHNFPHNFKHYTKTDGPWSASEAESRALLRYCFDHSEIAMTLTLGRTNSLKNVPESNRRAEAGGDKFKLPKRWAKRMGVDPEKEFPMKVLLPMARDFTGYKELTEDMLLQWLDAGAKVNPDKNDLGYWKEISKRFNDFLKENELDGKALDAPGFSDGCFEEWAYYQYGVPSFSLNFWTLPEPKKEEKKADDSSLTLDQLEGMSTEEVVALGEEKIAAFLKAQDAPEQYTAAMVIKGLEGGMMNPKRMAKMMRKSQKDDDEGGADEKDEALFAFNPDAFVAWQPYSHPTLGEVEIGGMIPMSDITPPSETADEMINKQLPFIRDLAKLTPQLTIKKVKTTRRSADVWHVEAWIANEGFLPYPTHQGKRCQRPAPAVAKISGRPVDFLEGRPRRPLGLLGGSGGVEKVSWLVKAKDGSEVTIEAHSFSAGADKKVVTLKEATR
ncbi:MAG: M14 family zinc carboxypeptidase [candidate division Zixibacteria bacterium]|nr:M14 family zinc carboxypeptidase [candidate division Zixibacteria bacterium]